MELREVQGWKMLREATAKFAGSCQPSKGGWFDRAYQHFGGLICNCF